jgi:hypothetical protein
MDNLSTKLEETGWNYGYLYERLILEGKQKLAGIQTIVVPLAYCCPPALAKLLLDWTRQGGSLILVGPCGLYDQYGKPANALLRTVFGDTNWRKKTARPWAPAPGGPSPRDEQAGIYAAAHGQGKVVFFADLDDPFPMDKVAQAVQRATRPTVRCSNPDFKLVLRQAPEAYYAYVVNINARPLEGPGEGAIALALPVKAAADVGLDTPVSVPLKIEGKVASFALRLAQGEGTLIRLSR